MDYTQFLYMKEELSLIAVILILFLVDLFVDPKKRQNVGTSRLAVVLPVVLMLAHTLLNVIPGVKAEAFGGMYQYLPMHTIVKTILNLGTIIVMLMAGEWLKREDT